TVTRLVVSSPSQVEKEDCELPTLRPVIARPVAAPTPAEPVTTSTSLAALRPRRHQAQPVKSPFKLEALEQKRRQHRQERLERIVAVNDRRCAAAPVYGSELLRLCAFVEQARSSGVDSPPEGTGWRGLGYAHCLAAQVSREARQPEAYWRST
ncbi:hypothetical protein chiPu_0032248, partial [Chiloscyllium punctatum]|nr:hypothetical protein [Chiloscyllium punctatum]